MEKEYLSHHGIKGQKWGVRRYQKSDGSYTDEGKRRYGVSSGLSGETKSKIKTAGKVALGVGAAAAVGYGAYKLGGNRVIKKAVTKGSPRDLYKSLTDEELQSRIGRLDLELKLAEKSVKASTNNGSKFVASIGKKALDKSLTAILAGTSYAVAKHYIEEVLGYTVPRLDKK